MNALNKNLIKGISTCLFVLTCSSALALDIMGRPLTASGQGTTRGLQALYNFRNVNNGIVPDISGVGTPLNLQLYNPNAVTGASPQIQCNRSFRDPVTNSAQTLCYADFNGAEFIRSVSAATKISNACGASNEMTVEVWMSNDRADDLTIQGRMLPFKILTMGRGTEGSRTVNNVQKYLGNSNDFNFFLGIDYNMAAQFAASVRQGARVARDAMDTDGFINTQGGATYNQSQIDAYEVESTSQIQMNTPDTQTSRILAAGKLQQVVYTVRNDGNSFLYMSSPSDGSTANPGEDPFQVLPSLRVQSAGRGVSNQFSGWGSNFMLTLGNEATNTSTIAPTVNRGSGLDRTEDREWRGQLYLVAVYCAHHTDTEILGAAAPGNTVKIYPPNPAVNVTPNHQRAADLYARLTGLKIPVTAPIISGVNDSRVPNENYANAGMVQRLQANDEIGAALMATQEDGFLNITVKDFAKRMSTREETVNVPLNDFVASIIGTAKDNRDAREILYGNFFYMANPTRAAVPSNIFNDILMSNSHYDSLENLNYNLAQVLMRVDQNSGGGQRISNGSSAVNHPDPAGVLTSRAFLEAHATAGTNRRIIEFAFRQFACIPITGWATSQGPDNRVGPDVDRYPGGDHQTFLTSCRGCHSNMDGLRGAFAKVHFNNGFVKHADIITAMPPQNDPDMETNTTMAQSPAGVAFKMNRNNNMFPQGFRTTDASWINNAYLGSNNNFFGWNAPQTGTGMRQFGQMLSGSTAFPVCMTKRAFRSVCKREPSTANDMTVVNQVATDFRTTYNYNLRSLFARIATEPACTGN